MDVQNEPRRKYELKKRAAEMAETRLRITEAAVELHGTVGPARTTMSAVAERAGVQRHTLYRHFPTDDDLLAACSSHYRTANPWPDLEPWRAIDDPRHRLTQALDELYAHYERTAPMLTNILRDEELVEAVQRALRPVHSYLAGAVEALAVGWHTRGRRRRVLVAALRHAIDFQTWRTLTEGTGVTRAEATGLVTSLVESAALRRPAGRPRRRRAASAPGRALRRS